MSSKVTLDAHSPSIKHLCKADKRLNKVINTIGPISYMPHENDEFAFLVHEIIEQMLSVKAGHVIYSRFKKICGGRISPEVIVTLSLEDISGIGTSSSKASYIKGLAEAVLSGSLDFEALKELSDAEVYDRLTSIKGIGSWTAKMYLIFVLDRQDILPYEDGAFLQVYRWLYKTDDISKESILKKCKKWRPYSSIATRYCYRALDSGLTKKEFHLFK